MNTLEISLQLTKLILENGHVALTGTPIKKTETINLIYTSVYNNISNLKHAPTIK